MRAHRHTHQHAHTNAFMQSHHTLALRITLLGMNGISISKKTYQVCFLLKQETVGLTVHLTELSQSIFSGTVFPHYNAPRYKTNLVITLSIKGPKIVPARG